ncbi:MAG: hypothetical protein BWX80_01868 [Candidatus Hydrogenedentes bacterium ADurb.Bin101]|nr:MAG: hypothetical protein BWX80_01868 [Candidatus Hydrogenedentes bacterium ADurb.Bin101]
MTSQTPWDGVKSIHMSNPGPIAPGFVTSCHVCYTFSAMHADKRGIF